MRRIESIEAALVAGLIGAVALATIATSAHAAGIESMSWLAGCWKGGSGDPVVEEQWMAARGGLMLGMGRTVAGERVTAHEHMRIQEEGDRLVFTAKPAGKAEDSFRSLAPLDDGTVFENLEHTFPQRIIYRRATDGSLAARIEGKRGDQVVGIDYSMRRVDCAGQG